MLRRLAQMGVATDAKTNDDFRRVRELPGWPELEASMSGAGSSTRLSSATSRERGLDAGGEPGRSGAKRRRWRRGPTTTLAWSAWAKTRLRLAAGALEPVGLAYDSASRRFVVGDGHDNKLIVADEVFNHVNDLIGATSAGFGRLSAVEIDTRRGDLWVTSSEANGVASIHKLQLVSGRVLARLDMPASLKPIAISDFAVLDSGGLLLLDSAGGRLVPVKSVAGPFERAISAQGHRRREPRDRGGKGLRRARTRPVGRGPVGRTGGRGRCTRGGVARRPAAHPVDEGDAARAPEERRLHPHGQNPPVAPGAGRNRD